MNKPLPTLARSDALLRPISRADAADWFAYAGNPEVMRHTSAMPASVQELRARIELALNGASGALRLFALRKHATTLG